MTANTDFPITAAKLLGNWCETLFYGIYLVTCALAVRALFLTGRGGGTRWLYRDEIRWLSVSFAAAFFVLISFNLALGTYDNYVAFIFSKGPDDTLKSFQNLASWVSIGRCISVFLTMLLADFILIQRCWVVYARRWIIIMPSIVIWLTNIAVAIRTIQLDLIPVLAVNPSLVASHSAVSLWNLILFILATTQNILSTSLLILRIWKVERSIETYMGKHRSRHLRKVIIVIAESGAFYTTSVLLCMILVAMNNNGFYLMSNISLPSAGIAFNAILKCTSTSRDEQFMSFNRQSAFDTVEGPTTIISANSELMHSQTDNVYSFGTHGIRRTEKEPSVETGSTV